MVIQNLGVWLLLNFLSLGCGFIQDTIDGPMMDYMNTDD